MSLLLSLAHTSASKGSGIDDGTAYSCTMSTMLLACTRMQHKLMGAVLSARTVVQCLRPQPMQCSSTKLIQLIAVLRDVVHLSSCCCPRRAPVRKINYYVLSEYAVHARHSLYASICCSACS
eukprot:3160-Heterococcus_DN1.PRE.3